MKIKKYITYSKMYARINSLYKATQSRTDNHKYVPDLANTPKHYPVHSKDPNVWGPHLWRYLHYSAANYPTYPTEEQIENMYSWLCTLHVTIPCENCSYHYQKYINHHKPHLRKICSDKEALFNFLVDIHNQVNKRNGKPVMSYAEAKEIYGCK